jgi:hypothetical protein
MAKAQTVMDELQEIAAYNYAVFAPTGDVDNFRQFPTVLPVGSKAPDFMATRLDDTQVRLSDYTRRGPTVIEFGSIT